MVESNTLTVETVDRPHLPEPVKHRPPYCIDCKFYRSKKILLITMHLCSGVQEDLVTGNERRWNCYALRRDNDACGENGDWFEPKPVENFT
jgi:hypothetical protein